MNKKKDVKVKVKNKEKPIDTSAVNSTRGHLMRIITHVVRGLNGIF